MFSVTILEHLKTLEKMLYNYTIYYTASFVRYHLLLVFTTNISLSMEQSVAYDRSSAPKHCRVSGWLQGQDSTNTETSPMKMFLLSEFTYDLEKSNAQTFKVDSSVSNVVDHIRLDFTSNHGAANHTCIYRLRVHGYKPDPQPALEMQS